MADLNVPSEILDRIKKLLNQNELNGATAEEAATATAMANKLLLKYNLSLSDVDLRENGERITKITQEFFDMNDLQNRHEADWIPKLFHVIARHNLCRVIQINTNRMQYDQGKVAIIGESHNIQIVYYMVDSVINITRIMEKNIWNSHGRFGSVKRNSFRRGFFIGIVEGIAFKLAYEEKLREKQAESNESYDETTSMETGLTGIEAKQMGLMVMSNKEAIQEFVEKTYDKLKKPKTTTYNSIDSRKAGFLAGKEMNLSKGLDNNVSHQRLH